MKSNQVYDAIEQIAATSSRTEKTELLRKYLEHTEFKRVIKWALDPFITFGVQKVSVSWAGNKQFDEDTWKLFESLRNRVITGDEARAAIVAEIGSLSPPSQELFHRILNKDLRAGFSETTVNKILKNYIPEFPYMRCSLFKDINENFPWHKGAYVQEKADGMFVNVLVSLNDVLLTSRNGKPVVLNFTPLEQEIIKIIPSDMVVHGELVVEDTTTGKILERSVGSGIINHVSQGGTFEKNHVPVLFVWDIIPQLFFNVDDHCPNPYSTRYRFLESYVKGSKFIRMIPTEVVYSLNEALNFYKHMLSLGKEGAVLKNPDGIWRDGTSKHQFKLKLEVDVDLRVVGFREGKGKNAELFGAFECQTEDGLLEVGVSGIPDKLRQQVAKNKNDWLNSIVTIKANAVMQPGKNNEKYSLFLPRFVERRNDKDTADTLQRVIDQFESALK